MITKRLLPGFVLVLLVYSVTPADVFLPPAGDDDFPTVKATFTLNFSSGARTLQCGGPITVHRSDPSSTIIPTEMIGLDLRCDGGVTISLNPSRGSSIGQITSTGDSFFDVFLQINGLPQGTLHNESPLRIGASITHVAPWNAQFVNTNIVSVVDQQLFPWAPIQVCVFFLGAPTKPESSGEVSPIFSCFYECKPNRFAPATIWREVTTLMLVNQSPNFPLRATMLILDGNENPLRQATTILSPQDLDEVNVCETLNAAGVAVPQAGVVEVLLTPTIGPPVGGAYGWVKNVVGAFVRGQAEPFNGFVSAVGKTECRLVGPNVSTPAALQARIALAPPTAPILVEGTNP